MGKPAGGVEAPSKFKTTPYKHQLACLQRFGGDEYYALLAEMGTGKSWVIINDAADLWASGHLDSVLIFAPNGVHSNWTRNEIPKHMPDWCRHYAEPWASNAKKAERERIHWLITGQHDKALRIFTMNWEALQSSKGFEAARTFCQTAGNLMVVCDESDAVKNPTAKRTKNLMKLATYADYRRIMSGTPITNSPFDAFSQFNFLSESILGTSSYYAFKAEYGVLLGPGHPLYDNIVRRTGRRAQVVARVGGRPQFRNLEQLSKLIAPVSFRVLKADCLDLPEKIYTTALFDLTDKQQRVYKRIKNELRVELAGEIAVLNVLTAMGKLAQVTSGYYLHPDSEEPVRIEGPNPKLKLLVDRVNAVTAQGNQVIVWARYRVEIDDIMAALADSGVSVARYDGSVGAEDRQRAIDEFESGNVEAFVANQAAGATGLTLVAASYVIYYSNSFSLRDRLQSEDRAHRIGQTKNVTYINLVGRGTIDEYVTQVLESKKDVATAIVDSGLRVFD